MSEEKKRELEIWQGTCEIQKKWRWEMLNEINIQMFSISILPDIHVFPKPILNCVALNKTFEIFEKKKISRIFAI